MELEFIRELCQKSTSHPRVAVGIGDDAAEITWPAGEGVLVCTDMIADGTDFHLAECGAEAAGRKALAVNLSDIAAMGATPVAAFVSMHLPRENGAEVARGVMQGVRGLADEFGVAVAGGDTGVWDHPLVINIALLGETKGASAWQRKGAKPGDRILVTGIFGGSIFGKHLNFQPRINEASLIRSLAEVHSAIDVSDGLSLDLHRLCEASGVGAVIEAEAIPLSQEARQSTDREPLAAALSDGEDFELIMTVAPDEAEKLFANSSLRELLTDIGIVTEDRAVRIRQHEEIRDLPATGYVH